MVDRPQRDHNHIPRTRELAPQRAERAAMSPIRRTGAVDRSNLSEIMLP